ncbi:PH domain-like protein [Venturia nashicola]|uniref:PH domain-like protein n=1 Tax=Venturia nashicola TaxID=86259 RepID=A0A4Z1NUF2_9PEZI|nr:PH domain-like protein [Venturia nashicola]TLD30038.1 PH domain-like protein [Venturia nashicola]
MAAPQRKTKRRNNQAQPQAQYYQQVTDYETDYQEHQPQTMARSNDQINISVLRRHWPDINTILSTAPYAELYVFSHEEQKWEKAGKGGTLFVCTLTSPDPDILRYSAVMLNRKGLDNFAAEIKSTNDVELTEDLMIYVKGGDGEDANIYGLWIHAEPNTSTAQTRELNAEKIIECAVAAEASRKGGLERIAEEERLRERMQDEEQEEQENDHRNTTEELDVEEEHTSAPMGRQLNLSQLFDRQRAQDSGFDIRSQQSSRQPLTYHSGHSQVGTYYTREAETELSTRQMGENGEPQELEELEELEDLTPPAAPVQVLTPQFQTAPDTDFFRSGPKFTPVQEQSGQGAGHGVPVNGGNALLEDMFRRQRAGQ